MKHVTIYTTPACGYCQMAKSFFSAKGVDYEEINVAADQEKAEEMVQKSGQMGVPVIVIGEGADEKVIVGFDQGRIKEALEL